VEFLSQYQFIWDKTIAFGPVQVIWWVWRCPLSAITVPAIKVNKHVQVITALCLQSIITH